MTRRPPRSPLGLALALAVAVALAPTLVGCGGGPPRKPVPPDEREDAPPRTNAARERFRVLGIGDEWHDGLTLVDGLKRLGGVADCFRDRNDGAFVVVYDTNRTNRDALVERIVALGREEGRAWEPIFEER